MKCGSCGAIGSPANSKCEFCDNNLLATKSEVVGNAGGVNMEHKVGNFSAYVQGSLSMVQDLRKSPSSGLKFWALLFPVAYLWGYGARENAKNVATVIIAPQILIWIVSFIITDLALLLSIGQFLWTAYVHFMVATRIDVLTKRDNEYSFLSGLVAGIIYYIVLNIFAVNYYWY